MSAPRPLRPPEGHPLVSSETQPADGQRTAKAPSGSPVIERAVHDLTGAQDTAALLAALGALEGTATTSTARKSLRRRLGGRELDQVAWLIDTEIPQELRTRVVRTLLGKRGEDLALDAGAVRYTADVIAASPSDSMARALAELHDRQHEQPAISRAVVDRYLTREPQATALPPASRAPARWVLVVVSLVTAVGAFLLGRALSPQQGVLEQMPIAGSTAVPTFVPAGSREPEFPWTGRLLLAPTVKAVLLYVKGSDGLYRGGLCMFDPAERPEQPRKVMCGGPGGSGLLQAGAVIATTDGTVPKLDLPETQLPNGLVPVLILGDV